MVEEYIEKLKPEVLKLFERDSTGHDITHLERTMKLALKLQKYEGGDEIVVGIAAFLHDVHRLMQITGDKFVSPKESLPTIKEILSVIELSKDQLDKILHAIEFHEVYNWNNKDNKQEDINTLILQDADNLDAIGAIGLARSFVFAGAYRLPMYEKEIPLKFKENYSEENGSDVSTIHHCYHKLFKLKNYMNTNTAKKIAEERTKTMENFVENFLKEWEGVL